ncbi:carbohydrate porin [Vibrio sp. JC009]|uniref:carbohydrate porin n=1 Tax=Vibrio sp. JC009 TaxID=2912314 RepID=UPI0023B1AE36|nr:carbohydrate porin [Vibrio sp. JC009]WED24914.1 carbohydrate porin [Vibrio sp. JC009]
MKKVSVIAAAVVGALLSGNALAEDKVAQGWTVNGYAHLLYNAGESLKREHTWEHRRDYRAAGAPFSANPNQVEFTVTRGDNFDNGAWAKYVLQMEYGNHEDGNGRGFYHSSSGNEGHLQSGNLEAKQAYIELGDLSFFDEGMSIWAGQRKLNRQAGIITKEFWKQSSGVGGGFAYNDMGVAIVSADPGAGSCTYSGAEANDKNCKLTSDGKSTTLNSLNMWLYSVEGLGGRFDFDFKMANRANTDKSTSAEDGFGGSITYSRDYYGFDGWSTTAFAYGEGILANRGVNFGQFAVYNDNDRGFFFTSYGVANVTENLQIGTEIAMWNLDNKDGDDVWGTESVNRTIIGVTPSYKVNENFRWEGTLTYAVETLGDDGDWGREKDATSFYTATLAPVFTVNADYWGRPQIKPYVSYMGSSDDGYTWSDGNTGDETRFGVEAEIWF